MQPSSESGRIDSLDQLRGFALLGILLMNIIGFGLHSVAYSFPGFDLNGGNSVDIATWASMELLVEGAMRCLFSMLFGAGVLLFFAGPQQKSAALYYKRTFWLLMFGLFNAYLLLWPGDILVTYALCGALLYLLRRQSAKLLLAETLVLMVLISASYFYLGQFFQQGQAAAELIDSSPIAITVSDYDAIAVQQWRELVREVEVTQAEKLKEYAERGGSYRSAFNWSAKESHSMISSAIPTILFWDALVMMLLGMALYKLSIIQGAQSAVFYRNMTVIGFALGLSINGFEVYRAYSRDFAITAVLAQLQPSYQWGRLAMAIGYIGLINGLIKYALLLPLRLRLACVGRMALTNYLLQSLIAALLFTGLGWGLVGQLSRSSLYVIVLAIWLLQLVISPWWLSHYRFGPVEWLWRGLTYGSFPANKR